MTKDEQLSTLRRLELRLRSLEVQTHFEAQDEPTKQRFVALRIRLTTWVESLTNEKLVAIEQQLDQLDSDLHVGIAKLQRALDDLADTMEILNGIEQILGAVGEALPLV